MLQTPDRTLTAPELYAISQSERCIGENECYWCAGKCGRLLPHLQPPPQPFVKTNRGLIKRIDSPWVCRGCWLFRRTRITVEFLSAGADGKSETFKDIQAPMNWGWVISESGAWAVRTAIDKQALYEFLLDPPLRFCLSLLSGAGQQTHLQVVPVNDLHEMKNDSPLAFMADGVPFSYTPYELASALEQAAKEPTIHVTPAGNWVIDMPSELGVLPGVHKLLELLGPHEVEKKEVLKGKRAVGRPRSSPDIKVLNPATKTLNTGKTRKSG